MELVSNKYFWGPFWLGGCEEACMGFELRKYEFWNEIWKKYENMKYEDEFF